MADSQESVDGENQGTTPKPPVTMKVEAPAEDSCKQDNDSNERREENSFSVCSPSNKPSLSSPSRNPFSVPLLRKNILRPPQLSLNKTNNTTTTTTTPKSFVLNPSRLTPLVKKIDEENSNENDKKNLINGETPKFVPLKESDPKSANPISSSSNSTAIVTNISPVAAVASGTVTSPVTPVVVAAATSSVPPIIPPPPSNTTSNSFVFGQNLRDRVIVPTSESKKSGDDEPEPSTSLTSNGTTSASEMLFSSAVKNDNLNTNTTKDTTKSLSESAREYEESRANKRKYEEVEVKTGEEGETNILNINCKLFAFDKNTGSWQERGRGTLRLNDLEDSDGLVHSRLVFRTAGSLRVVLNTKIWAEMTVEKASEKSVRFTAQDANGDIKVFLSMASMEDSKHLLQEVKNRVEKEVAQQKHKKLHTSTTSQSSEN